MFIYLSMIVIHFLKVQNERVVLKNDPFFLKTKRSFLKTIEKQKKYCFWAFSKTINNPSYSVSLYFVVTRELQIGSTICCFAYLSLRFYRHVLDCSRYVLQITSYTRSEHF